MPILKVSLLLCVFWLSGCTQFRQVQQLQNMDVSLTNISPTAPIGLSPRFNIQLLIANPNPHDVAIEGVSLKLAIARQNVLSGLSNQIPTLAAYSETPVEIQASINLFSLYKLVTYLSQHADENIYYQLNSTIDPKGFIAFDINKEGLLNENILQNLLNKSD